jgi:hypothetical protein
MGRRPIGKTAMTDAERQQRRRDRLAAAPDQIVAGVISWLDHMNRLPVDAVPAVLDRLAAEIKQRQRVHRRGARKPEGNEGIG